MENKTTTWGRIAACLGVGANVSQIASAGNVLWQVFVGVTSLALTVSAYLYEKATISHAIVVGLFGCACLLWIRNTFTKTTVFLEQPIVVPMPTGPITNAEEKRLEWARQEVRRLSSLPKTVTDGLSIRIHAGLGPHLGPGVRLGPADWEIETRSSLAAMLCAPLFEKYEKILRMKDDDKKRDAAESFLKSLAETLTLAHLFNFSSAMNVSMPDQQPES